MITCLSALSLALLAGLIFTLWANKEAQKDRDYWHGLWRERTNRIFELLIDQGDLKERLAAYETDNLPDRLPNGRFAKRAPGA